VRGRERASKKRGREGHSPACVAEVSPLVEGGHEAQLWVRDLDDEPLLMAEGVGQGVLEEQSLAKPGRGDGGDECEQARRGWKDGEEEAHLG
jgi:hypothetical protein